MLVYLSNALKNISINVKKHTLIIIAILMFRSSYAQSDIDLDGLPNYIQLKSRGEIIVGNSKGIENTIDLPLAIIFLHKLENPEVEKNLEKFESFPKRSKFLFALSYSFLFAGLGQIGLKDGRGILFFSGAGLSALMALKFNKKRHLKDAIHIYNNEIYLYKLKNKG